MQTGRRVTADRDGADDAIRAAARTIYDAWLTATDHVSTEQYFVEAVKAGVALAAPQTITAMTPHQRDLLIYLAAYVDQCGHAPSFEEMKDALGLGSKSGIHRLLTGLEERGAIRRLHGRNRAIEILRRAA